MDPYPSSFKAISIDKVQLGGCVSVQLELGETTADSGVTDALLAVLPNFELEL